MSVNSNAITRVTVTGHPDEDGVLNFDFGVESNEVSFSAGWEMGVNRITFSEPRRTKNTIQDAVWFDLPDGDKPEAPNGTAGWSSWKVPTDPGANGWITSHDDAEGLNGLNTILVEVHQFIRWKRGVWSNHFAKTIYAVDVGHYLPEGDQALCDFLNELFLTQQFHNILHHYY